MSLKRNILANYISQIYVMIIGIVMVPMYVGYMGTEAYGLVGFFVMLQAWFQLLDMGLTPTIARETARYKGGATDALRLRGLLRAMEGIFLGIAILGCAAMMVGAEYIARSWLKVRQLPLLEVQHSIMLIAAIVSLRWICGLYRSAINGFERLIWLSGFNIAIATARFVLVIPYFICVGTTPTQFFSYQLVLAFIELAVLLRQTYHLLPLSATEGRTSWQWKPLKEVLRFSVSIAFTSSVWVFVTQTDKLILSKLLPLTDYAYFTLAVLVASGVSVISGPISAALLPRMCKLAAEEDDAGLIRLYRNATQSVAVIAIPTALVLAYFSEQVLWAWTGNVDIAKQAAPVLTLYVLGNGILVLSAFPYYLQFAKGDLQLHMIGSGLFLTFLIPALIWGTLQYGMVGAGWAWFGVNLIYFLTWVAKVHGRFAKGLHRKWLVADLATIFLVPIMVLAFAHGAITLMESRMQILLQLSLIEFALLAVAAVSSYGFRNMLATRWQLRRTG